MELYSIDIRSWTSSFRYPNLISGIQPTLEVPPISTVLGLVNAAAGHYVSYKQLTIGYYFEFQGKETDLETIYMIDSNKGRATNNAKSNVIKREVLFENLLRLYVTDEAIVNYFRSPVYSLVLGRMNDLAFIDVAGIKNTNLEQVKQASNIRGQIVPFANNYLPGIIQALPKYFTDSIPRKNIGTESFSIINHKAKISSNLNAFRDTVNGKDVDIFLHQIDFENL